MRDIQGYEGLYAVTSCGRIYSYTNKRFLKPWFNNKGYLVIKLCKDGIAKNFRVNRLVALAYIENPDPERLPHCGHLDDIKEHNYVSNLYWTNEKENNNHGAHNEKVSKAKSKPVVCVETGEVYESATKAAAAVGRSVVCLCRSLKNESYTCAGLHWQYANI